MFACFDYDPINHMPYYFSRRSLQQHPTAMTTTTTKPAEATHLFTSTLLPPYLGKASSYHRPSTSLSLSVLLLMLVGCCFGIMTAIHKLFYKMCTFRWFGRVMCPLSSHFLGRLFGPGDMLAEQLHNGIRTQIHIKRDTE